MIRFKNFSEYYSYNKDFIESKPLDHFYIKNTIKYILDNDITPSKYFNIASKNNYHLAGLLFENTILRLSSCPHEPKGYITHDR